MRYAVTLPIAARPGDGATLATALTLGDDLEGVVAYDERLVDAAGLLGLPTMSPGAG